MSSRKRKISADGGDLAPLVSSGTFHSFHLNMLKALCTDGGNCLESDDYQYIPSGIWDKIGLFLKQREDLSHMSMAIKDTRMIYEEAVKRATDICALPVRKSSTTTCPPPDRNTTITPTKQPFPQATEITTLSMLSPLTVRTETRVGSTKKSKHNDGNIHSSPNRSPQHTSVSREASWNLAMRLMKRNQAIASKKQSKPEQRIRPLLADIDKILDKIDKQLEGRSKKSSMGLTTALDVSSRNLCSRKDDEEAASIGISAAAKEEHERLSVEKSLWMLLKDDISKIEI